jgi:histidyl-tRNA synthetase
MALSTQPYKGARDFYPEDKRLQDYMFNVLRTTVEQFGYEEYDAPILESLDLYLAKTGEEIVNEQTYTFTDRGGRQVVIRPEMTPTVSRMVAARRQLLAYPLRWYSIPNLWRYERPQRGRLREHWQLNIDIFGVATTSAELEMIQIADQIYKALGAREDMYEIRINSRKFMDFVLREYIGLDEMAAHDTAKLIDKMHKLDEQAFITKLDEAVGDTARKHGATEKLLAVLRSTALETLPAAVRSTNAVALLRDVLMHLNALGISNARFDVTLMRGFDYYTDIIFEVFDNHPDNNRSMMGGGRYDGLVGLFGVAPIPTVGFGLGDATLANFLRLHNLLPEISTYTDIYAVLVGDVGILAQKPIMELRNEYGLNVAVDLSGRKIGDQLKIADKKGITFALIIGEEELAKKIFTLKNLKTGKEQALSLDQIAKKVHRKSAAS